MVRYSCVAPNCQMRTIGFTKEQRLLIENEFIASFHKFPADSNQKQLWIEATGKPLKQLNDDSVVCSLHFNSDCYDINNQLLDTAVPTIFFDDFSAHLKLILRTIQNEKGKSDFSVIEEDTKNIVESKLPEFEKPTSDASDSDFEIECEEIIISEEEDLSPPSSPAEHFDTVTESIVETSVSELPNKSSAPECRSGTTSIESVVAKSPGKCITGLSNETIVETTSSKPAETTCTLSVNKSSVPVKSGTKQSASQSLSSLVKDLFPSEYVPQETITGTKTEISTSKSSTGILNTKSFFQCSPNKLPKKISVPASSFKHTFQPLLVKTPFRTSTIQTVTKPKLINSPAGTSTKAILDTPAVTSSKVPVQLSVKKAPISSSLIQSSVPVGSSLIQSSVPISSSLVQSSIPISSSLIQSSVVSPALKSSLNPPLSSSTTSLTSLAAPKIAVTCASTQRATTSVTVAAKVTSEDNSRSTQPIPKLHNIQTKENTSEQARKLHSMIQSGSFQNFSVMEPASKNLVRQLLDIVKLANTGIPPQALADDSIPNTYIITTKYDDPKGMSSVRLVETGDVILMVSKTVQSIKDGTYEKSDDIVIICGSPAIFLIKNVSVKNFDPNMNSVYVITTENLISYLYTLCTKVKPAPPRKIARPPSPTVQSPPWTTVGSTSFEPLAAESTPVATNGIRIYTPLTSQPSTIAIPSAASAFQRLKVATAPLDIMRKNLTTTMQRISAIQKPISTPISTQATPLSVVASKPAPSVMLSATSGLVTVPQLRTINSNIVKLNVATPVAASKSQTYVKAVPNITLNSPAVNNLGPRFASAPMKRKAIDASVAGSSPKRSVIDSGADEQSAYIASDLYDSVTPIRNVRLAENSRNNTAYQNIVLSNCNIKGNTGQTIEEVTIDENTVFESDGRSSVVGYKMFVPSGNSGSRSTVKAANSTGAGNILKQYNQQSNVTRTRPALYRIQSNESPKTDAIFTSNAVDSLVECVDEAAIEEITIDDGHYPPNVLVPTLRPSSNQLSASNADGRYVQQPDAKQTEPPLSPASAQRLLAEQRTEIRRLEQTIVKREREIVEMRKRIPALKKRLLEVNSRADAKTDEEFVEDILNKYVDKDATQIFVSQMKVAGKSLAQHRWTEEDKLMSLGLLYRNPVEYGVLLRKFTLPSDKTLGKFVKRIKNAEMEAKN